MQIISTHDETTELTANSNPIEVCSEIELQMCWADFHGQSEETVGENTIDDYFMFARDYGLLGVAAHQGNDFQVTDAFWEKINQVTRKFYEPGKFVTFPGYEWSGNTPLGGDRIWWRQSSSRPAGLRDLVRPAGHLARLAVKLPRAELVV